MNEVVETRERAIAPETMDEGLQKAIACRAAQPAQHLTESEMEWLAYYAPEKAAEKSQEIMAIARSERMSGERAASSVLGNSRGLMDRARFLALRESLAEEWVPRGGLEWSLIDQLAIAQSQFEYWTRMLSIESHSMEASGQLDLDQMQMALSERNQRRCGWLAPRITESEAIAQTMAMAERWSRAFGRVLRHLRDLRRYSPIVVNNGGQVNIGEQQVIGYEIHIPDGERMGLSVAGNG